ncbi:MAG: beta-lactamase family protein [Betaproteobacteria bacterium]|nr:beta-lactamase family protein [Betaproteobacteria bacterium]
MKAAHHEAIDPKANDLVREAIAYSIRVHGEVGVQVAAYLNGRLVIDTWDGIADPATGRRVDGDTLFNVFSVTKAVTAVAVHIQAERGLVDYDAPVSRYWPEFGAKGKNGTVRHALTHRLGVPFMPEGVTPETMCDWNWMVRELTGMDPQYAKKSAYHAITLGWILGEIVRRTDPQHRDFGTFVQEEICAPLAIGDLWIGIPDAVEPRVATLIDYPSLPPYRQPGSPGYRSQPTNIGTCAAVYGRPDVRRACIAAAGGIFNARSTARFFAMLANGGELDGVRLLSEARVRSLGQPRPNPDEVDPVLMFPLQVGMGGLRINDRPEPRMSTASVGTNPRVIYHPGAGGSIAWADPDARLAVAICHNRMFDTYVSADKDPFVPIGNAVRKALGIPT